MDHPDRPQLTFWGVRGSIPTPRPQCLGYGGNTACLELQLPSGEILIFDGGTGVNGLGDSLMRRANGECMRLNFFLTHFHWDHIQGIPFFAPLYSPRNEVTFYSFPDAGHTREVLEGQMSVPYFPVNFAFLPAKRNFERTTDRSLEFSGTHVRAFPMNHPQEAYGYRVEYEGSVLVFASDLEHGNPELDQVLRREAEGADVLIYDAQFTPEEYESRRGWGHSTWLEATRVAREVGAKRLILFHHAPEHLDSTMDEILRRAREHFPNTEIAKEQAHISF